MTAYLEMAAFIVMWLAVAGCFWANDWYRDRFHAEAFPVEPGGERRFLAAHPGAVELHAFLKWLEGCGPAYQGVFEEVRPELTHAQAEYPGHRIYVRVTINTVTPR